MIADSLNKRRIIWLVMMLVCLFGLQLACNFPVPAGTDQLETTPTATLLAETPVLIETPAEAAIESPTGEAPAPSAPQPTQPTVLEGDLALNKPALASREMDGFPASYAVDGIIDHGHSWNAGDRAPPPRWIEINLEAPMNITRLRLHVIQSPTGNTIHNVLGSTRGGNFQLLHTFSGVTEAGQVLEVIPDPPWVGIQYLRIETVESPSWVSWAEIEVFGSP